MSRSKASILIQSSKCVKAGTMTSSICLRHCSPPLSRSNLKHTNDKLGLSSLLKTSVPITLSRFSFKDVFSNLIMVMDSSSIISKGPFIYYVSTFFINRNIFTNFLSIFHYLQKKSNYSMKILSKCNVEKEILLF